MPEGAGRAATPPWASSAMGSPSEVGRVRGARWSWGRHTTSWLSGPGVHGLATAYYLARNHGVRRVAVLDKGYIGGGGSGRNTAIIRSNYLTPEGVRFYERSVQLYRSLAAELNFNVMFARRGHLTLAHTDSSLRTMRWRAEVNKLEGVDSEVISPEEVKAPGALHGHLFGAPATRCSGRCTTLPAGSSATTPSTGATPAPQMPSGSRSTRTPRSSASAWSHGRVSGVTTSKGRRRGAGRGQLHRRLGQPGGRNGRGAPAYRHPPLQAAVTEPVKMFLQAVVVSGSLHVYVSQTDRGELVFGASTDPYPSYSMRGSLEFTEELASHVLELMPGIAKMRVLRQWAGLCDITPDFSPIMGVTEVDGFLVDVGWGTYGFKAGPAAGESMAELVATGKTPELIAAFDLARFSEGRLVGERGAAAVGH